MTALSAAPAVAPSTTSPLFWRQLLSLLKSGQVVPVVGQDVLKIETEDGPISLNQYVAHRVEEILEIPPSDASRTPALHEVACRYLARAGDREIDNIYTAVNQALDERPIAVPEVLRKLAGIEAFNLYVSTTFDDLMRRAIDEVRFRGQPRTQVFAYHPEDIQDIPKNFASLNRPAVYHLLGRASERPTYVVTEEDALEFVHSLQSANRSPTNLMDELKTKSLLLIGSGFSDWQMRFFLRTVKPERLLFARSNADVVVDARARDDASLADFLRTFSAKTKVFSGDELEFVSELASRWEDYRGPQGQPGGWTPDAAPTVREPEKIFISYAHEDKQLAESLVSALEAAGLPVWFDKSGGLQGGQEFGLEIQARISSAPLFVPLVSRVALLRGPRYFHREWNHAVDVAKGMPRNQVYIVPVRLDDVPPNAESIDEGITKLHWLDANLADGHAAVVERIKKLYRDHQYRAQASA